MCARITGKKWNEKLMSEYVIYHNPRCSKSRATLALLEEHGVAPKVVEYLKSPPNATELERILTMLKKEPRELMRSGEREFKQAGLDDPGLSRSDQIKRMVANPKVIERPIVVCGDRAIIGRPPENVRELF